MTALNITTNKGHVECLKKLITAGAEVNKEDKDGRTALMIAANTGLVECLKELIAVGADINKQDNDGPTALMRAVNRGHVGCLKELIAAGADINKGHKNSDTTLMLVAFAGHVECLKELIAAGVDINKENKYGQTALMFAANQGHIECVKELIAAGAEIKKEDTDSKTALNFTDEKELKGTGASVSRVEPLISAVKNAKAESVEELLKSGADVNVTDEDGNTALMTAVKVNSKSTFQSLVKWNADVNAENHKGETALYLAVTQGHAEYEKMQSKDQNMQKHISNEVLLLEGASLMVYMLLREGAHLHETKFGLNPCTLHLTPNPTVLNSNPTVLMMLDAAGAKKDIKELSSVNLLQDCARDFIREHLKKTHPERNLYFTVPQLGLPQLLQSSLLFNAVQKHNLVPNTEEKEFLKKIKEGDTANAQHLINAGFNVNVQDENDMTPLMIASQAGQVEIVELLIKSGADVNFQNSSCDTAFIYAFNDWPVKCQVMQMLLKHHADINIQGKDGETALMHLARETSHSRKNFQSRILSEDIAAMEKCMFALIDAGADPNLKNDKGCTALILGANHLNFVQKLIKAGADVNWEDRNETTALNKATDLGAVDCIEALIESGAKINSRSVTPLMIGALFGQVECMKLLIREGADLNIQSENGTTALTAAAGNGHVECVKLLVQVGADLDIRGKSGQTALTAAVFYGHVNCVKLLIRAGADLDIQDKKWPNSLGHSSILWTHRMSEATYPIRS